MQTSIPVQFPDDQHDTVRDELCDAFTRLAAQSCSAPIALIDLIAGDRHRIVAHTGLDALPPVAPDVALSAHTGAQADLLEIADVLLDERFGGAAQAQPGGGVRFYAGVPLRGTDGGSFGTLCVMDREPRRLTAEQRDRLRTIAGAVSEALAKRQTLLARFARAPARSAPEPEVPAIPLELQIERLTALTSVARDVVASLEPRSLVDALVRGVAELSGGGSARLLARGINGALTHTHDLGSSADPPVAVDEFLRVAIAADGVSLSANALRAAVPIRAPSGTVAYVLDIAAGPREFIATDTFTLGLLGQYLSVAIRNVELYAELESRRAAVAELNQVKNDLIAMLAHDFKGPLTTIVGLADVLAEDERFDSESRQFLGMINSSATRLASLATDTLALSRLEQNEVYLRFEDFDLVALMRDIVRVFSVTRGIDIRCAAEAIAVRADPARLRQVFENLIGNAIKYSPGGETVYVDVREKRGGVEVKIRDRGIGIPQADIPKLFGRFARGSNARERGIGGTGFGLYFSRTIVERHGGVITIESTQDSGSTFRVRMPTVPVPQRTRDRRILLLDNEEDGRSFIAHALRDEGYAVYVVPDESEFLRALDEHRYDAAIVDFDRSANGAAELAERVGRRTRLIRLASSTEAELGGAGIVLRKPFLMKDLRAVVESAVADRRLGSRRRSPDR